MDRENLYTLEKIIFDVCLGITKSVRIKFLTPDLRRQAERFLEDKYNIEVTSKEYSKTYYKYTPILLITNGKGTIDCTACILSGNTKHKYRQVNKHSFERVEENGVGYDFI